MKLLLDTCAALWFWGDSSRLPSLVQDELVSDTNDIIMHQASTLEMVIKVDKGKLTLPATPEHFIPQAVNRHDMEYHTIANADIFMWAKLPPIHSDPFDRLLIAHAICTGAILVTPDKTIARYPVRIMWD